MDRKEFLTLVGMSAGAYAITRCLGACSKPAAAYPAPPTNVNMTLNLSDPANAPLNTKGGYIYNGGLIIACVAPGASGYYLAVSEYCTHQGTAVVFQSTNNDFYCSNHGSTFASNGLVAQGPATIALQTYNVKILLSTGGNSLHIYS